MDSTNDNPVRVTLGDFEIHEELGRGGMGVVYRARQISLKRIVALKVLKGSFTLLPTAVERFRREAAAAARLHHSSIVPIYATGSSEDQHFYAMELIEGFSLDKVLDQIQTTRQTRALAAKRAPLTEEDKQESLDETEIEGITDQGAPVTEGHDSIHTTSSLSGGRHYYDSVARIIADVADALDYAHGRGVIHRDIKPGNLILSNANRIYITDFGLARVQEEQGLTVTGGVMGSPHYMSPEQVTPGHEDLDHRTDIYSLGVTLYELITLQAPFKGVSKELVMNHILTREPKSPRKLSKRVPHDLETICLKAMDKRADRRYQTASELAADLRRFINRFAISARRVGPVERTLRWSQRHPSSAGLIVASVVAVIALSGLWTYKSYSSELEEANKQARINTNEAGKQRRVAEAASAAADIDRATAESERAAAVNAKAAAEDQKNFGQYVVNITRASHALEVEDGPKAQRLLEHIRDDPGQQEMMGFEWGYLMNQCRKWQGKNVTPLWWKGWPLSGCSFSTDGDYLAVSGHYGRIMLIDGMNDPGNWDSHQVVTLATVKSDESNYGPWVNQVSFSPDERYLAASSDDHTIRIWEMAAIKAWNRGDVPLEAMATLTGHEGPVYDVTFSKESSQLASGGHDGTVKIWNIETPHHAALLATLKGHTGAVRSVAFSPAGNGLLASAADDGIIITWKRTGKKFEETGRTRPNDHPMMSVAFSPDGHTLASGGLDSTIRLWNSENLQEIVPLNGHRSGVIHVTFSPKGEWIASTGMDQTVQVWNVKGRAHDRTLQGHFGKVWRSVFSPDGKGLVSVGNDGSAKIWNLTNVDEVAARDELTINKNGSIWSSRFSPDGKMIADIEGGGLGFVEIKIRLWENVDVEAGSGQPHELDAWTGESKGSWMACDFSPDSTQLVYCKGGNISLWNLVSGEKNQQWNASLSDLVGARFNPTNGRQVAVWGKDRFVRLFDTVSQTEIASFPAAANDDDGVRRVEFFPDGKSLATLEWNDPKVLLWDVESGSRSGELTWGDTDAATCLAISPDSRWLAVGYRAGKITIWNAQTHEQESTFSDGHRGQVNGLAFLDDGKTLVSTSTDSTVRFWNLKMFKEVVSMNVVPAKGVLDSSGIHDISTTARGSKLISAAGEPRIKIWTSAE